MVILFCSFIIICCILTPSLQVLGFFIIAYLFDFSYLVGSIYWVYFGNTHPYFVFSLPIEHRDPHRVVDLILSESLTIRFSGEAQTSSRRCFFEFSFLLTSGLEYVFSFETTLYLIIYTTLNALVLITPGFGILYLVLWLLLL